jgi:hypothetical protein
MREKNRMKLLVKNWPLGTLVFKEQKQNILKRGQKRNRKMGGTKECSTIVH